MKYFKRILVSFFAFVMIFTMVGCGKNNDNNENNNNNNQNTNPPEVVYLTTSQVLGKVYNKIKTSLTKSVDDNPSFADGDGSSFYNDFVYAGITVLNEVSKYEGLVEDKVLSSDEFVLTYEHKHNYANKIDRFYIKNDKNNEINKIELTIIASRKNNFETNNLDSILVNYEINYNETTDKCLVNCVWEKSSARGEEDSEATYYSFIYDDSDEDIKVYSFKRDGNIDLTKENNLHGLIVSQIIKKSFIHIYFNLKGGYKWSPSNPTTDNDITDPLVQDYIIEVLTTADTSRKELSSKDVELEKQEFFTAKILYVLNS